jgi:hypothetical protein
MLRESVVKPLHCNRPFSKEVSGGLSFDHAELEAGNH